MQPESTREESRVDKLGGPPFVWGGNHSPLQRGVGLGLKTPDLPNLFGPCAAPGEDGEPSAGSEPAKAAPAAGSGDQRKGRGISGKGVMATLACRGPGCADELPREG